MTTKKLKLYTWKENIVSVVVNRGEVNSRYIEVTFENTDGTLSLEGKQVTLYTEKPDGTKIFNNCTVDTENNTATVSLTSQMSSVAGSLDCEFQIIDANNSLLKVNGLQLVVASEKDFSEAVESTSEFNALTQALNQVKKTEDQLENFTNETGVLSSKIGSLDNLTTTQKTSLVDAVNELNSKVIPISQGGTGSSTLQEAKTALGISEPVVLFDNLPGISGTITLSEVVTNYQYVEIFYSSNSGNFSSCRILRPSSRSASLSMGEISNNTFKESAHRIVINYITITMDYGGSVSASSTSPQLSFSEADSIGISRVLGYK